MKITIEVKDVRALADELMIAMQGIQEEADDVECGDKSYLENLMTRQDVLSEVYSQIYKEAYGLDF